MKPFLVIRRTPIPQECGHLTISANDCSNAVNKVAWESGVDYYAVELSTALTREQAGQVYYEALCLEIAEARKMVAGPEYDAAREKRHEEIMSLRKGLLDAFAVDYVSREDYDALKAVWHDPAAHHANLLRNPVLTREQLLHLAGAGDYDTVKQQLCDSEGGLRAFREEREKFVLYVNSLGLKHDSIAVGPIEVAQRCIEQLQQRATAAEAELSEWHKMVEINRSFLLELALAANHVMQPWEQTPVPQLVTAVKDRIAAAEAACAEMRAELEKCTHDAVDSNVGRLGDSDCQVAFDPNGSSGEDFQVLGNHLLRMKQWAQDMADSTQTLLHKTTHGTGWLPPESAALLRATVEQREAEAGLAAASAKALEAKIVREIGIKWEKGPSEGGENSWTDGDNLLVAIPLSSGKWEFHVINILADDGHADAVEDFGWSLVDIAYWCKIEDAFRLLKITAAESAAKGDA